ncbi:MAG: twin-arginine translocation signal domain-containing protein [Halodesulfurarchaeum sp.]|nr:twin-arginine translocation signal domain-containing protein [Halodesulfurarchaeum sp.]
MNRRRFVQGLAVTGAAALAGCSAPVGTEQLGNPEVSEEDSETHLTYRDGSDRVATTSLQYGPIGVGDPIPVRLSVWHQRETTLTDLTVTFRNRDPTAVRPSVYVGGFSGSFPAISYGIDPDTDGRVLEIPNLSRVGDGTVTLDCYVRGFGNWPLDLAVDVAYGIDAGLTKRYQVDGTVDLEIRDPNSD